MKSFEEVSPLNGLRVWGDGLTLLACCTPVLCSVAAVLILTDVLPHYLKGLVPALFGVPVGLAILCGLGGLALVLRGRALEQERSVWQGAFCLVVTLHMVVSNVALLMIEAPHFP